MKKKKSKEKNRKKITLGEKWSYNGCQNMATNEINERNKNNVFVFHDPTW